MYTDIDCEYHSHLSTLFNLTLNCSLTLHMLGELISIEGPYHIHISVTVRITWQSSTTVHH